MTNRLQVGIDFSQKRADLCLLWPQGDVLEAHLPFTNSRPGYEQAKALLLEAMERFQFEGLNISGEATGYYWLPFFQQLASDPDFKPHHLELFLLNPRWVYFHRPQSISQRQRQGDILANDAL